MTQRKFAQDMLKEFSCYNLNPVVTPLDCNVKLQPNPGSLLPDRELYRKLVGKLNY